MVLIAFPNTVKKYRIILYSAMIIVEAYFVGPTYFDYSLAFGLSEGRNALRSFFCMGIMAEALFAVVAYVGVTVQMGPDQAPEIRQGRALGPRMHNLLR